MKLKLLLPIFFIFSIIGQKIFAAPLITSFSPASGPVGTLVTVTGTGLSSPTAFTIGGVTAVIVSNTSTQLVGMVMPGAKTGEVIRLSTDGGSTASQYTFTLKRASAPGRPQFKIEGSNAVGKLGTNIAVSADGNTAIITGTVAVGVYVRSGDTWSQQAVLSPSDNVGDAAFGVSLAVSADGNTAIIGGNKDNRGIGAAWVFIRNGAVWQQQGPKLVGTESGSLKGNSVSISADGSTAVIGAPGGSAQKGGAFVFKRLAGIWQQWGNELIGSGYTGSYEGEQGYAVALSADGKTLASGAPYDSNGRGGFWTFVLVGGSWVQQGTKISWDSLGSQNILIGMGRSLAITADGNQVLSGGYYLQEGDPDFDGFTWMYNASAVNFKRANGQWTVSPYYQLFDVVLDNNDPGPVLVSFNADGQLALIQSNGTNGLNVGLFDEAHNLVGSFAPPGDVVGASGLSTDGGTALVANNNEGSFGSVSAFVSADRLSHQITFNPGPVYYGAPDTLLLATTTDTQLPIKFTNSSDTTVATIINNKVHIKAAGITNITAMQDDNAIAPVTAALIVKKVPLTISVDNKRKLEGAENPIFTATYTGFKNGDDTTAVTVKPIFSTTATSTSPPGDYAITASGAASSNYDLLYVAGTLTISPRQQQGPPKITSFSPASGPVGTLVTIFGANIEHPSAFTIGGAPAVIISNNGTQLVAMVMPGAATGGISVTTASGTSASAGVFSVLTLHGNYSQQGQKVQGSGGIGTDPRQGYSVALSADGNTAVIGAPFDNASTGAIYIFVRNNGMWQQQGNKLVGTESVGTQQQGVSVAISSDGNTIAVGGNGNSTGIGGAWIFTRSNAVWTQQGAKILRPNGAAAKQFGSTIALSADGNTMAVGAVAGSATYIYTRTANTWTMQATINKIGYDVALSADGNTLLGSDVSANSGTGAGWVFTRNGNVWTQQGVTLVGTGGIGQSFQGYSVGLSADGNTAVMGAPADNANAGAFWVFTRNSGGVWSQQGSKMSGSGAVGSNIAQGRSVAISADGNTIVESGYIDNNNAGATWIFRRTNGVWAQLGKKLVGTDGGGAARQGSGVGISADGTTVIAGGEAINSSWFFVSNAATDYITFAQPGALTYGAADTALVVSSTNTVLPIQLTSDDTNVASIVNNKVHIKAAGTVNITASQASDNIAPITRAITIIKAQLTITADDKTKIRGTENPVFTATYSGFKNGDDSTALNTKPVFSTTAAINSPVGSYPITISGGASLNYQVHYVSGTLKVTAEQFLTKFVLSPASNYTVISQTPTLTTYKTSVAASIQSVTLTPYSDGTDVRQVTINGVTVAGGMASAPIQLDSAVTTITMVATTKLGTVRTYVIQVHKDGSSDVRMKILALAEPSAAIVDGIASVSSSVNTVRVRAVPMDSTAQVKVNGLLISGDRSDPVALNTDGTPTKINAEITTAGGAVYTYYFQVNKSGSSDVSMKILALADPSAALEALTTGGSAYSKKASVSFSTNSVRVYAVPNDAATTVKVNGVLLTGEQSDPVTLTAGNSSTNINVTVTAENGATASYTIQVNKTGSSDLSMKIFGLINPSAVLVAGSSSGTIYNRTASVSASTTSVTVRAIPTDAHTTVKVNGTLLTGENSAPVTLNSGNVPTDINVLLTAETGVARSYVIRVSKTGSSDVTLKTLKLTNPTASVVSVPVGTLPYDKTATVPASASSVRVYAVATDAGSSIKVNGTLLSGTETAPISLNSDTTIITVLVTSESGSSRTYLIGVNKAAASMRSFAVSAPPISTDVVVHQAVSPNGDGQNDILVIDGLTDKQDNHISIVDINGSLVYETKAYGSNGNVFDGHSGKTGTLQKPGTYYYVLDYNDGTAVQRKTGYIILKY